MNNMLPPLWHFVVIAAVFYVSWRAILVIPPRLEIHRAAKYHYVNAGVCCTLGQLLFMFLLFRSRSEIKPILPFLCFFTWTITVLFILLNSSPTAFVKRFCLIYLIIVPFLLLLYPAGVRGFLRDVDDYTSAVFRGATIEQQPKADTQRSDSTQVKKTMEDTLPPKEVGASAEETTSVSGQTSVSAANDARREPVRRVTVSHILKAIFFFIQGFVVINYYGNMWYYRHHEKVKNIPGRSLSRDAADQVIFVISIAMSAWLAFVMLGFDALSVSVFSGLVAVGVSVALRDLLTNFVAGMLLFWDKSIRVNDVIAFGATQAGRVKNITMRYMVVQDRNDIEYLVPHTQLVSNTVENWTRETRQVRLKLDIGVASGSPVQRVKEIMVASCFEVPRVLKNPLPNALIMSMGDSTINFQLRFRISDPENGIRNVMSDVYEKLLVRFAEAKIEIPFPQREFRLRKPARIDPPESGGLIKAG